MTQDYKDKILDYITNNVNVTGQDNQELIEKIENVSRTKFAEHLPTNPSMFFINGIIRSMTNNNYVLYGGYVPQGGTQEANSRGIILILDTNFNVLKAIYSFNTGTPLRPIQKLIQIEDNTFVGVDSTIFAYPENREKIYNNTKRFIMLNNISVKDSTNDYRAILRTSYNLPYSNFYCMEIVKNPNTAHYLLAGATYLPQSGGTHYDGVRVIDLKINVGTDNEWSKTDDNGTYWIYGGFYGEFDNNDNANWKMIITHNINPITVYSWNGTQTTTIISDDGNIKPYVDSLSMKNQAQFVDENTVYFVVNNQRWYVQVQPRYIGLYKYDYTKAEAYQIFLKNIGNYDYNDSREGIFITSLNGELYVNYCDNWNKDNQTANYNFQRLDNDLWKPNLISQNQKYTMERTLPFTANMYNLVTNITLHTKMEFSRWHFEAAKEIYNKFNYNSTPYNSYNSVVPHTGTLYGTNGILFARDLYNVSLLNSSTTSTIQVPNTLLNEDTITQENLISETNTTIVSNSKSINKNIYETLYINYINTLGVIDEDLDVQYPLTANYINQNINVGTKENCEQTFVGKVQVVYESSTVTQNLIWTYYTDHYETSFTIDATVEIPYLLFMSDDLSTIYLEKQLDIEIGDYYVINQKLRIE